MSTDKAPTIPEALVSLYGNALAKARFLTRVQNFVYEYDEGGERRILRLTPAHHRNPSEVEAELEWVRSLAQSHARVSAPIPSRQGRLCHSLIIDGETFTATVFSRAKGRIGEGKDWTYPVFEEWGRCVGNLHRLSLAYRLPRGAPRRAEWKANLPRAEPQSKAEEIGLIRLAAIEQTLTSLPRGRETFGLVHADLHFWNFAVDEGRITAFDFENAEYNWFLSDIGTIIFESAACCHQQLPRGDFITQLLIAFSRGYRSEFDCTSDWSELLPLFVKLREVSMFLVLSARWRNRKLGAFQQCFFDSIRQATIDDAPFVSRAWIPAKAASVQRRQGLDS